MMILQPILLTLLLYCITIHPFRWHRKWKIAGTCLIAVVALKFQILHLFGGPWFFAPDLPRWIQLFSAWLYASELIWFFSLALFFLLRLLLRRKFKKLAELNIVWYCHLALLVSSAAIASAGICAGTKQPEIREYTLAFPDLPKAADGMKLAMLTDLHIDSSTPPEWIRDVVRRTNQQTPDVIVITGDFADGTPAQLDSFLRCLSGLQAPFGVYGIPGNHEYYFDFQSIMSFLSSECGIRMLQNESVQLPNGVWLAGIPDERGLKSNLPVPDLWKTCSVIPPKAFAILLAHHPKHALLSERDFQLQLSGHTHGGMMPVLKQLVKLLNYGFVSGFYEFPGRKVYVSNGTGIWRGFPVRIFCPSEITVFRLVCLHQNTDAR